MTHIAERPATPRLHLPPRRLEQLALGAIVVGALLRVVVFLQRRPLWIDEAMVALNIGRRDLAGFLSPLDWDQVAPIGWLALESLLVRTFGMHEWVLRVPALLAGIATPWVVWRVARPWVGAKAALIATVLVATNAALIYHANEAKPYALDALVAIALLGSAWAVLAPPTTSNRRAQWWRLAVLGVLGTLFSLPAILVLAGIGVLLLAVAAYQRDRGMAATTVAVSAVWLLAFLPVWVVSYRPATLNATMQAFWFDAMAQLGSPGLPGRVGDLLNQIARMITTAPPWDAWPIVVALVTIGAALLWTQGRWRAMVLITSPLAMLGAGWLTDQVAVGVRVSLWAVPSLTLLAASTLAVIGDGARWRRNCTIAGVLALAVSGAVDGVGRDSPNGGRDLIEGVMAQHPDVVYLSAGALPHWLVATTDWSRPDTDRLDTLAWLASSGGPLFHNPLHRTLAPIVPDRVDGPVPQEIMGRSAGIRIEYGGHRDLAAISGWGEAEAERISAHANRGIHVLMIFAQPAARNTLFRGLRTAGVSVHECGTEHRAWWWYVGPQPPAHCRLLFTPEPARPPQEGP
ncbi:MAG: glycosyltransferase family 39 protein [Gemmatimonadota bacterium]